jgi:hypothetical protein
MSISACQVDDNQERDPLLLLHLLKLAAQSVNLFFDFGGRCTSAYLRVSSSISCSISSRAVSEGLASIAARGAYTSDGRGCIHRSLSRISLFFWLRGRPRSAHDHTPYHQQTLGTSCLPWSYPHRVSCQLSDSIVAWGYGWVNKVEKQIKDNR